MIMIVKALSIVGLLITAWMAAPSLAPAEMRGRIVVAGHGPELPVMQELGRAFEKAHPGTAIDFQWDRRVNAVDLVKAGKAQVAVTDQPDAALKTVPIAWDGIAVIVNFTNRVTEATTNQVKDLFTGKITRWSDLDGGDQMVEVLPRAPADNIQSGLETSLGIAGRFQSSGKAVFTDESALRAVSGRDRAISYLSLAAALKAQEDGIPIRILTVDRVEPGPPTVKSGAYKLRRPVLMLSAPQPDPLTEAFIRFATSAEAQELLQSSYVPHAAAVFEWSPSTHVTSPATQPDKQPS
jgi:phosphate transport system substrate-binding protein